MSLQNNINKITTITILKTSVDIMTGLIPEY